MVPTTSVERARFEDLVQTVRNQDFDPQSEILSGSITASVAADAGEILSDGSKGPAFGIWVLPVFGRCSARGLGRAVTTTTLCAAAATR